MQIVFGSIFRDAEKYINRYAEQVWALREAAPQHTFRLVLAEGDSTDDSYEILKANFNGAVAKRAHGGPVFGSVDSPVRFRQMAWTWESVFERIEPADDVMIRIEGDLIWDPQTMLKLIGHLEKPGVDIVSPLVWFEGRNYDTWGQRGLDGKGLGLFPPFHRSLLEPGYEGLYPLSSTGSCLVMKGECARMVKFEPPEMEVVGWSWGATRLGYKIFLDPKLKVRHPE